MPPKSPETNAAETIERLATVNDVDNFMTALLADLPMIWASDEVQEAAKRRRKCLER